MSAYVDYLALIENGKKQAAIPKQSTDRIGQKIVAKMKQIIQILMVPSQIPTEERESPGSHEDAPVHGDVAVGEGELSPRLHQVVHLGGHHRVLEELQYWHYKDTDVNVSNCF